MLKVKCRTCGNESFWNDFDGTTFRCPNCGDSIDVRQSLKDNIDRRMLGEEKKKHRCPNCRGFIDKRYFAKCPSCGKWLIGKYSMSGKWFIMTIIVLVYLLVSIVYHNFGLNENPGAKKSIVKEWLYRQEK